MVGGSGGDRHQEAWSPGREGVPVIPRRGFANTNMSQGALRGGGDIQGTTRGWGGDRSRGSAPALALKSARIGKLSIYVFIFPFSFLSFLKSSLMGKDPVLSAMTDPCLQTRGAGVRQVGVGVPAAQGPGTAGAQRRAKARGPFPAAERGL